MDNKDWTEFKKEYREDQQETRKELRTISGAVTTLANEMTHKVTDADLIPEIDKRIHFHKRDCAEGKTGVVAVEGQRPSVLSKVPVPLVIRVGQMLGASIVGGALAYFGLV